MLNKLRSFIGFKPILCFVLGTFSINTLTANAIEILEVPFTVRLESTKSIINLLIQEKRINDLIQFMFILKSDIEKEFNCKIDFDQYFELIHQEPTTNGTKISRKSLDTLKVRFLNYEKKIHKGESLKAFLDSPELAFEDFILKVGNGPHQQTEVVPSQVVFGVTVALCGLLFMFMPIGGLVGAGVATTLETWGAQMFATGAFIAAQKICDENDSRNYTPNNQTLNQDHSRRLVIEFFDNFH